MTTRDYVRRPIRAEERYRIDCAMNVFTHMIHNLRFDRCNQQATCEIRLPNRKNPNGFTIRLGDDGKPTVERYINLKWARDRGYDDAFPFRTTLRRKRRGDTL